MELHDDWLGCLSRGGVPWVDGSTETEAKAHVCLDVFMVIHAQNRVG